MNRRLIYIMLVIAAAAATTGCNITKSVPDGDALYTGATVKIEDSVLSSKKKKSMRSDLASLVRPKPNKKILGIRFKLAMYNLAGNPKKEGGFRGWLKNKVGEPPVLLSDVNHLRTAEVLQSNLENTGYFHAKVTGDTTVKGKKATATYVAKPGPQYKIREVVFNKDSSILTKTIDSAAKNSLLKPGDPFDLGVIKSERDRIDTYLKERGFYYFDGDYLIIRTDSTIGNHEVNLYVHVKPQTPKEARLVYRIRDIYIFPSFRLNSTNNDTLKTNATYYKGYYVADRRKLYKPRMFEQSMQFKPGDVYNRTDHNLSLNRLVNLNVFKFVKNRFEVVPGGADTPRLNTYYYLTPMPKKSLRSEINASTKSNNLTGSSLTVGWRNRNTFRGGELFAVDATGGFEVQFSGNFKGYNTYRGGLETSLTFPRFLVPFIQINTRGGFVPTTKLLLGYDLLNKQKLYTMNSFRAGFSYIWKENIYKEHQLSPISINYVQPLKITQEYLDSAAKNLTLQKAIEKQFILGSSYNFNYNELAGGGTGTGLYFNGNIDLSGNIAGLVSGANAKDSNIKYIAGAQFSQYVKVEGDVRHYTKVSNGITWANRLIVGLGYPYGNSTALPFIKQFFVGGTNSIRAFRSRALGPGTYKDTTSLTFLPDQSGDIKLELNTELRAKLFSIVHGAIFVDAGNIWLYNADSLRPGAEFRASRFMKEIAVGAGVGLRFDISFLVLRLDLAMPLRKPFLPDGERWVIDKINFGDPAWRKENLIFNLGIGYPF